MSATTTTEWPARPEGEVFPELLDTLLVAQLLLYDRRGKNVEQARRNVLGLVKSQGLPSLGRIGSTFMYRKTDVIDWLACKSSGIDVREAV